MDELAFPPNSIQWSEPAFWSDSRVAALAPLERHLYRALLLAAFRCETRPFLPLDEIKLAALADAPSLDAWKSCSGRVLALFTKEEGGYTTEWIASEYARAVAEHEESMKPARPRYRTPKPLPRNAPEGFDEFWRLYPKKVGKKEAMRSWARLKVDETLRVKIMEALREQIQAHKWRAESPEFIPNPTTWINQARWEDELPCPRRTHLPSLF